MYNVQIIADSVSPLGYRLITLTATYPRFIHEELLTHKDLSRNSASSRAIPTAKLLEMVKTNPAMPAAWGTNKPGMQAGEALTQGQENEAVVRWLVARDLAVESVEAMLHLNLHKQVINRILQPYMWMTVVITATQWENFFWRRCHPDADPTFQRIAYMIQDAIDNSVPLLRADEDWHLPYVTEDERDLPLSVRQKLSAARCGRVSFLKPGESHKNELEVASSMAEKGHWSPFEHQARPLISEVDNVPRITGNLRGWAQLRKQYLGEYREQARYGRL
jgi:hypothetical protein